MTEEQMDVLSEAYLSAVWHLVTGRSGLRARLRDALAELEKCRAVCDVFPGDEFEFMLIEALPPLLEKAASIEVLTIADLEDTAWRIWAVNAEIQEVFRNRVGADGR